MPIRPTVARFAVASNNPPQLTDTIILADRVHAALVSLSNGSRIFTGCDGQGKPLQGNRHAHVFCESNNALGKGIDGEITHITIYAPAGFESEDQGAIRDLNRVWSGDDLEIQVILQGFGQPQDFGGTDLERSQCPLLARSRAWVSRTSFIPTRHPKVTRAGALKRDASGLQIGCPEHELRRLLGLAGFPEPVQVEPVAGTSLGGRIIPWHAFLRRRETGKGRPAANGAGYGFRIEFTEMVQGPVAVGYASHFGMGGFVGDDKLQWRRNNGSDQVRVVLKQSGYETSDNCPYIASVNCLSGVAATGRTIERCRKEIIDFSQNLFRVAASKPLSVHSGLIGCLCSPENAENYGTLLSFAQE